MSERGRGREGGGKRGGRKGEGEQEYMCSFPSHVHVKYTCMALAPPTFLIFTFVLPAPGGPPGEVCLVDDVSARTPGRWRSAGGTWGWILRAQTASRVGPPPRN